MTKKNKINLKIKLFFLAGVLILIYPTVSQHYNSYRERKITSSVAKKVEKMPDKEKEKNKKRAQIYNKSLVNGVVPDVFAIREGIRDENYENILNPAGNGVMGNIEIPSINVKIPIYHYTTDEVLEKGCGHIFGSSLPVGGENTHSILSAHRGSPSAKLFTDLDLLKEKDMFYIKILGETLAYEIDDIEIVKPTDTRNLAIREGNDYVTLVTCTPYGINTKRLLVRGKRVEFKNKKNNVKRVKVSKERVLGRGVCVILGVILAVIVSIIIEKIKYKNGKKEKR